MKPSDITKVLDAITDKVLAYGPTKKNAKKKQSTKHRKPQQPQIRKKKNSDA